MTPIIEVIEHEALIHQRFRSCVNGVYSTAGNCRVTRNNVDVWGVGVVLTIEAADTQIYTRYHHYEAAFDLADTAVPNVATEGL